MHHNRTPKLFTGESINELFQQIYKRIQSTIENESETYILNVNESTYIDYLTNNHKIDTPEIHFDHVNADSYEDDIPAEYFPMDYYVIQGKRYRKEVIQFFIPCTGETTLLKYRPANEYYVGGSGGHFGITTEAIVAEFINFSNDPAEIRRKFDQEVEGIHPNYNLLRNNIQQFNLSLKEQVRSYLSERKKKFLNKNNLLSSLGIPIRKRDDVAATFSVPNPQLREKIIVRPIVHETGFKPEPTLDNDNYIKILKLINDVGKNFERMPSVYKDKGEEDLRDHILMTLDPNFEFGSASGETFNKSGKTDIQLRYNSSVVFIAECKFWSGEKNFLSTISQLLGYLTWRDTKASVIVFVKQKDFSSILKKVDTETPKHSNYLETLARAEENWFNYRFHVNEDKNREIKLAIQLYHLPVIQ
ncbi:hypothetical protein [Hymenobacter crusticola]|uniref:Uncharacterized protein n=1 Tax=Hymenobacter crusticola TaxID=1770526 RepID=A0A243WHC4_9BACT|nr:hypothetical protein [Hymenobacter crusticola]OUJ74918.1 hypothetical protein BXP70_09225 [Hymenobacter crusticola]